MDFKKVLTAFLIVFVSLDIFLGTQWLRQYPFNDRRTTEEQIIDEMHDDGIAYRTLSKSRTTGSYVAGKDGRSILAAHQAQLNHDWKSKMVGDTLKVTMPTPVKLHYPSKNDIHALNDFIKQDDQVINGSQYKLSTKLSEIAQKDNKSANKLYVYVQKIAKEKRTFTTKRAQIIFEVTPNHEIKGYEQRYISDTQYLRDDVQLISEEQALISLYQYNDLSNNSQIIFSQLGYREMTTVGKDVIFVPTWQFWVSNNKRKATIITVNAINGAIMK
ncbi:two-component system regulatory protein YycI [Weissella hellenica]|nr:two-component system regulatory protein YycI [Weissella hellenica]